MKLNKKVLRPVARTHEGAVAYVGNAEEQLTRSVMSCMLWEDEFYESGESIATRITSTIPKVEPEAVKLIAIEAREQMKLRHVPLLIVRTMAALDTHKHLVAETLERVIQRADELTEFLAIYWKEKKQPLSAQVKRGLANAFNKFDAYQLAKYNRDGAIKLRDVLFLSHAKPKRGMAKVFKQLVEGTLPSPDTWEVALSAQADKKETFTRLIMEKNLGGLALLRNLRNMIEAGVDQRLIRQAIVDMDTRRILPFRFLSAAKYGKQFESELETAMFKSCDSLPRLKGHTVIAIDTSGSMEAGNISAKSEMTRRDAAAALAMILREVCDSVTVIAFGSDAGVVRPSRGFALNDEIGNGRFGHGTEIGKAVSLANSLGPDRVIVVTDEQSHGNVSGPYGTGYMINVGSYRHGVGYEKDWVRISGFSESIVSYIVASEEFEG